ncbi:PH domain-containing protein [Staphylococcus debuckii]|uniref:PH domain-containing protein n=1 Tax=Staphylococcus debuckii TaxID=2044912 RepID=A0ABU9F094_9STAP|nr:PH domain-containing protein [Staphylococcus debuckii]
MKLNRMSSNGKKVLLIEGIIRTVIVALCLAAALIINYFWLHWQEGTAFKIICVIAVVLVGILIVIDCILRPWLMYRQHGYLLHSHFVTVQEGMWFVKHLQIPLFRIQNVDIEEGWLMRKVELATLKLSTAGGNSEIILIDKRKAKEIMNHIKHSSQQISEETESGE